MFEVKCHPEPICLLSRAWLLDGLEDVDPDLQVGMPEAPLDLPRTIRPAEAAREQFGSNVPRVGADHFKIGG